MALAGARLGVGAILGAGMARLGMGAAAMVVLAMAAPAHALVITIDSIAAAAGSAVTPSKRLAVVGNINASVKRTINVADCLAYTSASPALVDIKWTWLEGSQIAGAQYSVKVAPGGKTCSEASLSEESKDSSCTVVVEKQDYKGATTTTVDLHQLVSASDCTAGTATTAKIYFTVNDNRRTTTRVPGTTATVGSLVMNIDLALSRPAAPTITALSGGESNLRVTWTHADATKAKGSRVYWSTSAFSDTSQPSGKSDVITGTSYQITGLQNGTTYQVGVVALDDSENESLLSPIKGSAPKAVQDFWQYYKASGGAEEGGFAMCTAAPVPASRGGVAWLLALAATGWLALRLRRRGVLLAVLGAVALPVPAHAVSPQTMSLDLRTGLYLPQIDREFSKTGKGNGTGFSPYGDVLKGSDWNLAMSCDWRLAHGVLGELGLGFSAALWDQQGQSRALTGGTTDDTTSLHVVPLGIDAVWRFDLLAERWTFPFVPYVRGGLVYALWWVENGLGNVARYTKSDGTVQKGLGATSGFHGTAGLRLLLDVFEPQAARAFDIEMGVNHSYLFAEFQRLVLVDFANPKSIDLSDDVVSFGIAFDL
jgi:hypothetical protein